MDEYKEAHRLADAYGVDPDNCLNAIRWELDDLMEKDRREKRGTGRRRPSRDVLLHEAVARMERWLSASGDPGTMLICTWASLQRFVELNRQARVWAAFASRAARAYKKKGGK